jgi:hypothetical protein
MIENGQTIPTASQSLGIGENLLYRWKSKQKNKVKEAVKGDKLVFLKLSYSNNSCMMQSMFYYPIHWLPPIIAKLFQVSGYAQSSFLLYV